LPKARPSPPEFFVDRSVGRYVVADAVRALGFTVHVMAEVYPADEDERVPDTQWIADADAQGWVVLTKDERITRRPQEQEALRVSVFGCSPSATSTSPVR
jgi:hypothetical protein